MTRAVPQTPELAIVVPVFNEQGNIELLVNRVRSVMEAVDIHYELILVDDGSKDATWSEIQAVDHPQLRAIRFSRNFGHQHALYAGLLHATAPAVASMDGDLQHPPELLPQMLESWRNGAKVVLTHRADAPDASWFKRTTSKWFYRVFSSVSGVEIDAGSSDFRLLDQDVIRALSSMNDATLFLRGLVAWVGFPRVTLPYQAAAREHGTSKYNLRRMLRFALDGITSFSTKPLELSIWLSLLTGLLSLGELGFVMVSFSMGWSVPGWASIVGVMALLFSVVFLLLGIIGVYLTSIHRTLQNRPRFLIHQVLENQPTSRAASTRNVSTSTGH